MKHQPIRILSILLALVLAFSSLPVSVIAENVTSSQNDNQVIFDQNFTTETTEESDNIFIVQEDTTKRSEFEKHYICSDGTYVVASYAEAIHYKDDNGNWVDVDNRPVQTTEGEYTTHNGDFGISVPSSAGDGHLMRMDKGEHSLSWTLSANKKAGTLKMDSNLSSMAQKPVQSQKMQVNTSKCPEVITSNSEQPHQNHKVLRDEATFNLPNVSGKVRYNDLFGADEGVSVVYTTYRNKIEEDIYIEKPTDITSFSMEVAAPDLTPRLNANNSVDFLDNDGKMCYHVGIPYMMDANFAVLNDIETTVIRSGDTWVITYTPDAAWFTSEERVYPILLDPSITTNEYRTNIQDTYVEEGDNTVHSSEQLLYINGGTGNRKAVIRYVNLPTIDETMPLISAKMNFTAQYAPFSDVSLTLDYITGNRSTSISAYTYDDASKVADYSTGYILSPGLTGVSFNLTNYIYDILEGTGDFVLGYSTDGDTTFCYPFHSAESTTGTGPVLTITYGYSLPDGVADGAILALQNYGSTLFASVSGTDPAEYANVYQVERDDWIPTTNELFRLQYNAETGAYRLYSMASSSGTNRMLTVYTSTNGLIYGSKNVRLEDLDDNPEISQDWMIVSHDGTTFRLLPRSNMSVCLTANGDTEGTSSGTGTGSAGNVCVKTVDTNSDYQLWWLIKNDGAGSIYTSEFSPITLDNGLYYFINRYSGRYLYQNGSTAMSTRGFITDTRANNNVSNTSASLYQVYREFISWRITNLGDGYCTIQNPISMNYLYAQTDNKGAIHSNRYVKIGNMDENIPDNFKWTVYAAPGGGMIFKNKLGEYYLTLNETSLQTRNANIRMYGKYSSSSANFGQQVWKVFKQEDYVEPTGSFSLSVSAVDIKEQRVPTVTAANSNCSLKQATDFYYTTSNTNISVNNITGTITGLVSGTTTVTPTHKTTGFTYGQFTVKTNKNAIIIIPGIMGSKLKTTASYGGNSAGDTVWPPINKNDLVNIENLKIVEKINALKFNENGTPMCSTIALDWSIDAENGVERNAYDASLHFGTWDTYQELNTYLYTNYNDRFEVKFFQYDWRYSNQVSAQSLNTFIINQNYDSVVLIAHSMGGLVAANYLNLGVSQQSKVRKLITLGTPFLGSIDVVEYFQLTKNISDFLNISSTLLALRSYLYKWSPSLNAVAIIEQYAESATDIMYNLPSVYELFPNELYFSVANKYYFKTKGIAGIQDKDYTTYAETRAELYDSLESFNFSLMNSAESMHRSLYASGDYVTNSVDSYYIVGANIDTSEYITLDSTFIYTVPSTSKNACGDGTVATWSADLGGLYPSKTIYMTGYEHIGSMQDNTEGLVVSAAVFSNIRNIIS